MSNYKRSELNFKQKQKQITNWTIPQPKLFLFSLCSIAMVPLFIHIQSITGIFVNFILIFISIKIGIKSSILLSFIPSIVAVSSGFLPLALAPIIPLIIISNIFLVVIVSIFKNNLVIAIPLGAFIKFAFLYLASNYFMQYFLPEMFLDKVIIMMGLHQFMTAMVGGTFASLLLKGIKR